MCLFVTSQSLAACSYFYLRPFLLSASKKKTALVKKVTSVTFAKKKNHTNISAAMQKKVQRSGKALQARATAFEVRTRCENATAMLTQSTGNTRTSKTAVTLRAAANEFNITHSQLWRYVSYVVLLYNILFYTETVARCTLIILN